MTTNASNSKGQDLNRMIYQIKYPAAQGGGIKIQEGCMSYFLRDPQSHVSRDHPNHFHFTYQQFKELATYLYQKNPLPPSWMARVDGYAIMFHSEPCWQRVLLALQQLGTEDLTKPGVAFAPCEVDGVEGAMVNIGRVPHEMRQWLV